MLAGERDSAVVMAPMAGVRVHAMAHCPSCSHSVPAEAEARRQNQRSQAFGRMARVEVLAVIAPGQRCVRCGGSLDAARVERIVRAA
jgi:ribosomal protein S27AE